jgi:hypothetical protein
MIPVQSELKIRRKEAFDYSIAAITHTPLCVLFDVRQPD